MREAQDLRRWKCCQLGGKIRIEDSTAFLSIKVSKVVSGGTVSSLGAWLRMCTNCVTRVRDSNIWSNMGNWVLRGSTAGLFYQGLEVADGRLHCTIHTSRSIVLLVSKF